MFCASRTPAPSLAARAQQGGERELNYPHRERDDFPSGGAGLGRKASCGSPQLNYIFRHKGG